MRNNALPILLEIGALLSAEKDHDRLLELILRKAMEVADADAGTLYTLNDNELRFRIMITKSMGFFKGGKGDPIDLPPVKLNPENVCAAAVLTRELINVPDVYENDRFDFSGPRRYDHMTGYKTTSVLVVPMENDVGDVIGVLQLINAQNENGNVVPFAADEEQILSSIASQAAICLTNVLYAEQITELLHGFVRAISTAIDARSPYNANHTQNMAMYAGRFFDYEERVGGKYALSTDKREELILSVWLHDIGKLVTPVEIMDKGTRLGTRIRQVEERYGRASLLARIDFAEGKTTEEEYRRKREDFDSDLAFIRRVDSCGFLKDEDLARVLSLKGKSYVEENGTVTDLLTDEDLVCLSVRKGTLTDAERAIMQQHVVMTSKMLSGLHFPKVYEHIPQWAGAHHEFLTGDGYPQHLRGDSIPWQVRLLTILDIFEALTARDRPYKAPMPAERAFEILSGMVEEGKIDGEMFSEFRASHAWCDEPAAQ